MTIDGLTLTGGSVTGDNGGAILSNGANLTISNCAIVGNSASGAGGGLSIGGSNWTVTGTLVRGNTSGSNGGGLSAFNAYNGVAASSEVIDSSSFIDNTSGGSGGAIALSIALIPGDPPIGPAAINLTNVTIAANTASSPGGGVYANGGASNVLTIASSTIVDNSADTAGGIDVAGTATLVDSIVANNPVLSLSGGDLAGSFTANYNLIKTPATATLTGAHNIIGVDPLLGELGMNGGPTPTLLPIPNSPAIDAGDPAFASPPIYDQRGLPRIVNTVIDIGAVERQAVEDDLFRDGVESDIETDNPQALHSETFRHERHETQTPLSKVCRSCRRALRSPQQHSRLFRRREDLRLFQDQRARAMALQLPCNTEPVPRTDRHARCQTGQVHGTIPLGNHREGSRVPQGLSRGAD